MLGFGNNGSNSAQETSHNEEFNDSSVDFSANKLSTNKKVAQNILFLVCMAPDEAFERGHIINKKNIHPTNSN